MATLHGVEESGDVKALVLELVDGSTLAELVAHGAMPVQQALTIAEQVAEAVEAAHAAGIVHRDLKPANIKVQNSRVKVLDFGMAKSHGRYGAARAFVELADLHHTHGHQIRGRAGNRSLHVARAGAWRVCR